MNVGERIKRAREALRLSQAALAEAVGVQTNTVWRWENQRATPDVEAISQIAQTLGVPVAYFFCETGETEKSEGKNVVPPVGGSDAPVVFQIGEMRLELPPTPETYAFLERQLRGILPTGERLPELSQEDAGERSA